MRTILRIVFMLKYLGLLGLPIFFSDAKIWKFLWLFWLLGIFEILVTFPTLCQCVLQILGILSSSKEKEGKKLLEEKTKVSYSLPFEGRWVVLNGGVTKEDSHSWEIGSQRYAYDFLKVDDEVKSFRDKRKEVTDFYCYGEAVLSPADGVVEKISSSCADSKIMPFRWMTDPLIRDIRGNYILIRHGEKEYSLLAHLRPGSLSVKEGERVERGQRIGSVGNSGNSTEPHLHFQVQDGKSFYFSKGIPISFSSIHRESQEGYEKIDGRKRPDSPVYQREEFIQRGMAVWNNEKAKEVEHGDKFRVF